MENNNQATPPPTASLTPFLHQVLSSFQDPLYNPETDNYKPMSSILWNLDIFRRNFQNLTDLTDFIELAKKNFTYEVHPYGSVLILSLHHFQKNFSENDFFGFLFSIFCRVCKKIFGHAKKILSFSHFFATQKTFFSVEIFFCLAVLLISLKTFFDFFIILIKITIELDDTADKQIIFNYSPIYGKEALIFKQKLSKFAALPIFGRASRKRLMKEHEFADKFCLVLQGSLQKLQQRPYQEVEQDIRNSPRRKTFRMNESQDDSFTQSSSFFPRSNVLIRKPNTTLLNTTNHRLSIDYSQAADSPKLRFKREQSKASLKNEDPIRVLPPSAIGESSPSSPHRISIRLSPFSSFPEALESPEISRLGTIGKQLSKNLIKPNKQFFTIRESLQRTGTATSFTTNLQQSPSLKANGRNSSVGYNESPENLKSWIKDEDEMMTENNHENVAFIKQIVSKSPEIKQRCFMMDAVRVRCTRTYQPGDYFGENFFKQHQFKENYIIAVASEEVHLAVLSREDYKSIINELASRPNNKLQFFKKVFPSFDENSVNRFSQYFYKKRFEKGETIYTQGEPANNLFLLQDGDVRLFKETQLPVKNVTASPTHCQTIELPIASITKGQFFGEEMLLNEPERLFTATSSVSNTIVYYLDPKNYKKLRGKYEDFLEILRDQAKNRFLWRKNRVAELSSQYKMTSDLSRKSLVIDEQLPSINSTIQKTTTQGLEKLSKRISRRTSTGLNLSLTQYLGENTVWATSKSTTSTRGKTSMREQIENSDKDLAEMVKSSGLYKSRFSRKTLSVAALGEDEIPAVKKKSDEPKNMLGRLGDSLKKSLVDLQAKKSSILQAGSPHNLAKQLTGGLGNSSPKFDMTKVSQHNESPSPSPTHSPKFIKRMSMSMEMNNEQAKGFPMMPLAVIKKEQNEGNQTTVKIIKRKSQKNMTTMSFFKGPGSPKTPKTPKIPLALGYPEAGVYELQLGRGFHSRSQGTLVNYMEDSPMNKDEGGNQWRGNGDNKKLKKILHMVNYHTGGHASREGTRREEGEKEFVNMHMQAMKKKAYNLIRVSDR